VAFEQRVPDLFDLLEMGILLTEEGSPTNLERGEARCPTAKTKRAETYGRRAFRCC
jgi:hypothetical protein